MAIYTKMDVINSLLSFADGHISTTIFQNETHNDCHNSNYYRNDKNNSHNSSNDGTIVVRSSSCAVSGGQMFIASTVSGSTSDVAVIGRVSSGHGTDGGWLRGNCNVRNKVFYLFRVRKIL